MTGSPPVRAWSPPPAAGPASEGSLPDDAAAALLDVLLHRLPLIVYVVDQDGTCTFSSGTPLARVGLVPGQAVGTRVLDPDSEEADQRHLRAALAGRPAAYTWTAPEGDSRFRTWLQPVRDASGEVTAVVGAALDVTDAWRAEASEHARVVEQQDVLHQLIAVQDAERQRISAGLHDDTVQVLAALALRVSTMRRRATGLDATASNELSTMSRDLSEAGGRLRDMVAGLQPGLLTRAGLPSALRELLDGAFDDDRTTVEVRLPEDGSEPDDVPRRVLYEIAVEAVGNVRKHAGAGSVRLLVEREGAGWRLEVADDGRGTDQDGHGPPAPGTGGHGFGLRSMRQRAVAAGGSLELRSTPGAGTTVVARVPDVPPFLTDDDALATADVRGPLEHILQNVSDAFVALDTSWRYVYVNRKAAELFGTTPDQLVGKEIWELAPGGADGSFHQAYLTAAREQRSMDFEDHFAPNDRWYRNRILPSSSGLTIFIEDVTDRRRLELRQQDTDTGSRVAHAWFVGLASRPGCTEGVASAVDALLATHLVDGVVVEVPGVEIAAGRHRADADVVPLRVGREHLGEVRVSWPGGRTAWTSELTVMLGQALSVRLAAGAPRDEPAASPP